MSALPDLPGADELAMLPADGGTDWNRLVFEQSPYLLQHADNPVQWYPWGEAALQAARETDKPIFLSIGYATCHWCHVMARESFEDADLAALINQHFIPVKVDREERPDIDHIYMAACQAMTGRGGWPLTCFLQPDGAVFYAGTYYPRSGQGGRPGMLQLLPGIADAWTTRRDEVTQAAGELTGHLKQQASVAPGDGLDNRLAEQASTWFVEQFDTQHGGFGRAPKFPSPHQYLFLLRRWQATRDASLLNMVERSLTAMRCGGIFDHVGLGFHRYSTDNEWLLPHFEKMLYDQAMLLIAYAETAAATGNPVFRQTALDIAAYVQDKLTHPEGGFFSAEDADSEGEEGRFYVWSISELAQVLSPDDFSWFSERFNVQPDGNFLDEATRQKTGANIPFVHEAGLQAVCAGAAAEGESARWARVRLTLYTHREKRVHPLLDDKVLTDWNGLMIAALARASRLLSAPLLLAQAESAWRFVKRYLCHGEDQLHKRFREGRAGLPAHLDDYAFMSWAALELHQATLRVDYLEQAVHWVNAAGELFWDEEQGGYFFSAPDDSLVVRQKMFYDGAVASGNAFMARNLAVLFHLTGQPNWRKRYDELVGAMSQVANQFGPGNAMLLIASELMTGKTGNLVLSGASTNLDLLSPLMARFSPDLLWLGLSAPDRASINRLAPFTAAYPDESEAVLYWCREFVCEQPATGQANISRRIERYLDEDT